MKKYQQNVVRPPFHECHSEDVSMLTWKDDDLEELEKRCLNVRQDMNENLPEDEIVMDDVLVVKESSIPNAGSGLFFMPPDKSNVIHASTVICYYTGHRHNFLSQTYISDKSYLMNVSGEILVDPGPLLSVKARYINDPLNERFINCKFIPEPRYFRCAVVAVRDILSEEELFVSYGDGYWATNKIQGTVLI